MLALVAAAVSGIAMAVQGSLNTALSKKIGLVPGTFIVHLVGTAFALALLLFGVGKSQWQMLPSVPWYNFIGGILGVGIVYGVMVSIEQTGVAAATTAIIVGQVSTAAFIDHLGLFGLEPIPFNWWKGIGIGLMAFSAWLILHH
ncbi:MAG: DMT family transporter [Firmicutes bacterium]|nr:DMT family transporter [Bacillota bacterium]NLL87332.1 DMT family transporter [Bacillota bacterium]HKM17522.1 DMT family transporter [Limnochordia bacterium]